MKESEIQNAICDYLALRGYFFWRQNTAAVSYMKYGERRFRSMPKHNMNGVPDIIVIGVQGDGRFMGLEVKGPKGKLSEAQLDFGELCAVAGADYRVVRSLDDVINLGL